MDIEVSWVFFESLEEMLASSDDVLLLEDAMSMTISSGKPK